MKYKIPLVFAFVCGILVVISEFIPHRPFNMLITTLQDWFMIISGFAILLGQISLFQANIKKIKEKNKDWPFYLAGLISFTVMLIFGLLWGTRNIEEFWAMEKKSRQR